MDDNDTGSATPKSDLLYAAPTRETMRIMMYL